MTPKTKKTMEIIFWTIIGLFLFNGILLIFGLSPFGPRFFLGWNYYDDVRYWVPAWLDNEHILFFKNVSNWRLEDPFMFFDGRRGLDSNTYLCSMKIDGTEKKELKEISTETGDKWQPEYLSWSNKNKVLISATGELDSGGRRHAGVMLIDLDRREEKMISETGRYGSFSPDGNKIVYADKGIWVMDTNSQNKVQLTDNPGDTHPLWSPDGTMVAFERNVEKKGKEIWVVEKDGKGERKVYEQKGKYILALYDWSPDGLFWSNEGVFDLEGKIIKEKKVKYTVGKWSPDGQYYVSGGGAVVDKEHNIIYILKDSTIEYGKRNRKQKNNIWTE